MRERYNASGIEQMSRLILKTVDSMEQNLEEIVKNLGIYRTCLKDEISKEAEDLVKRIHDRIDTIRADFGERGETADEVAVLIDRLEDNGLGGA